MALADDARMWAGVRVDRLGDRLAVEAMARRHIGELAALTREHNEIPGAPCPAAPLCVGHEAFNLLTEITDRMPSYPRMLTLVMLAEIARLQDEVARAGMAVLEKESRLGQADELLARAGASIAELRERVAVCEDLLGDARPYRTEEGS